jgi:hypothetical protein
MGQMAAKRVRRSRRARRRAASRLLTWAGILLLAAAAITMFHPWTLARSVSWPSPERAKASQPVAGRGLRVVAEDPAAASAPSHPYSVIPGGIRSEKQLAMVLASDPLVAKHYAGFDLAKFHFIRLRQGREAYVSYRLGDMIFWTSRKIPLFAGEMLVTDGTHLARARCGNRVSAVPLQPTSAFQPSDLALATPIIHLTPVSPKMPPLTGPSVHLLPTGIPGDGDGFPIFPVVFIPPGGGGGPVGGGPVYPPPGDAPLPTPEPGTLLLFSSGLAMLSIKYLWNLRRQ